MRAELKWEKHIRTKGSTGAKSQALPMDLQNTKKGTKEEKGTKA